MSTINSTSPYRVQGAVMSLEELAKNKPDLVVYKLTEAQINEDKAWEEQMRLREEAVNRYAAAHPNPIVGQVLVDGKVFATVFDPGGVEMAHALPGMRDGHLSPAERLAEIAGLVKGKIKLSDFLPTLGGRYSTIPDDVAATLPKVTARHVGQMRPEEGIAYTLSEALILSRMTHATDVAPKAK